MHHHPHMKGLRAGFVFGAALLCSVLGLDAKAHDAIPTAANPTGWTYGWECCSLTDCRQVQASEVSETPAGYVINLTGEIIPYGGSKIKMSRDEHFHHCTKGGGVRGKTICLYTPSRSF